MLVSLIASTNAIDAYNYYSYTRVLPTTCDCDLVREIELLGEEPTGQREGNLFPVPTHIHLMHVPRLLESLYKQVHDSLVEA